MRPTWIVLGLVVGIGTVAYVRLRQEADRASATEGKAPVLSRSSAEAPAAPARAPGTAAAPVPARAADAPTATNGSASAGPAVDPRATLLTKEALAKEALAQEALAQEAEAALRGDRPLSERVASADRVRRALSLGVDRPALFDAAGQPTEARAQLVATIASLNALVMTYRAGLPGVTTTYDVKPGDSPVRIVSRQKLPYGPNVLLFWNHGGNLDPSRLRAGSTLVLPTEPLEVRVDRARRRLSLWLGDALVKEFVVGVGKPSTPTPPGSYVVTDKYLNPDWHVPPELLGPNDRRVIPYGDPRNELGDAWIPISSPDHPTGFGIHGTNRPDTLGTECSNGCVRLRNGEAIEMTNWVRTGRNEGAATRVVIR